MKYFNICLLFIICALCYGLVSAQQEDGGPVSPAKRIAALRRPVGKAAKATTTTTPAPVHNDNGEEEDYGDEAAAGDHQGGDGEDDEGTGALSSTTTTTTEAPKKVGPVIRPFRSNDDFLNSLKRRQQNAKKHRAEKPTAGKQTSTGKKSDNSSGEQEQEQEPVAAAAPVPASTSSKGYKGNSALSRRKLAKPVKASPEPATDDAAQDEDSEPKEDTKPKRPIGRLALRKRN
ncbi:nucleolar and coiled-body phosphoprotein 1 [Drosophila tropicalis]|uniref:nucleolar and coiled-body phosphoprotein 1 n=1 Tax=Drosophila tropicalis TaxID=46794 RepID=UPI0035ABE155